MRVRLCNVLVFFLYLTKKKMPERLNLIKNLLLALENINPKGSLRVNSTHYQAA